MPFSWGATQLWHSMVDRASVSNDWSSVLKEPFVTNLSEGRDGELGVVEALVEEESEVGQRLDVVRVHGERARVQLVYPLRERE